MNLLTYARYELVRTYRNRRFVILSLGFPILIYLAIAAPDRHVHSLAGTGISARVYFMAALAAFGGMNAVLGVGARIAAEREAGWNRQLRLTPLSPRTYFRIKVLTAYVTAGLTLAILYLVGAALGVRLAAGHWAAMTVLLLVGLLPFAGLGILIGLLLPTDSVGPAVGGTTGLLGLLGGVWFPITGGTLHDIAEALPSYWLVQAVHVGLGGHGWGRTGWLVLAAWTAAGVTLASRAYARDRERPAR